MPEGRQFQSTHWSVVLAAGHLSADGAREALEQLCNTYWYPLYAFVRRKGHDPQSALDLTQGFFARLLEKNDIADADPSRGRFRSWLLTAMKHYMANEWDKANARKRGGGQSLVSIDAEDAESRYRLEPAHEITPERIFERRWALTLLDKVLRQLETQCREDEKGDWFAQLKSFLVGDKSGESYDQIGKKLGMTEGAVKTAVHRLRRQYRDLLIAEIAHTVRHPSDIEEEIRELFEAVA